MSRTRRRVLLRSLPLLLLGGLVLNLGAESPRPNLVLIMADDFGYECVGANGGTSYQTPALDQLAADGVRFEHCYAQPLCTPSRVKLMTGLANVRNYAQFGWLEDSQTTFANVLREAGYATAVVGKWQLGADAERPRQFGFEKHCLWHLLSRQSRYATPGLDTDGVSAVHAGRYGPDVVTDYACRFIQEHRDRPFLLYYPMILTHCPFEPTPHSADWDAASPGSPTYKGKPKYFADMVAYADHCVGRILAELESAGVADNTLVMFTGDNGTDRPIVSMLAGRRVAGGKGQMTDAGTRVPLIVRWPNRARRGAVSSALVDFSDFFPTLLEAAGIERSADDPPLDGISMMPELSGGEGPRREWIYLWYARDGGPTGQEFTRNRRYKLYRNGDFYDIANDVREQTPLDFESLSADQRAVYHRLQAALAQFEQARPARFSNWQPLSKQKLRGER